jgi:hypothetical protein
MPVGRGPGNARSPSGPARASAWEAARYADARAWGFKSLGHSKSPWFSVFRHGGLSPGAGCRLRRVTGVCLSWLLSDGGPLSLELACFPGDDLDGRGALRVEGPWYGRGGSGRQACRWTRRIPSGAHRGQRGGAAGRADPLGDNVVGLADQRLVGGVAGEDPPVGQVPPLYLLVPQADVGRVGEVLVSALPVPHLVPGVTGILQDGGDRAQRPPRAGRCGLRPGSEADGHGTSASFSARAIRATE